ncbi:hypothetical protein EXS54_00060 [Patescibacteria group bacterium]|nr:hypothetical protein [Patescibacteria group bacterium]
MNIAPDTKHKAARIGRIGAVVAMATLTLGTIDAEPVAGHGQYIARAESLNPEPIAASAPAPIVKQEIVDETVTESTTATQVTTATKKRSGGGGCGLDYIKAHESGGRYNAVSGSGKYRGAYQFDQRTWNSVGGSGDPAAASPGEQDSRAAALMSSRGSSPWSVCH